MTEWECYTAYAYYENDCDQCRDQRGKKQSHWVLDIFDGGHYWIQVGLNKLGQQGWELVAVQEAREIHPIGWESGTSAFPSWYIFKRPIPGS
jgi:hypothetical protein